MPLDPLNTPKTLVTLWVPYGEKTASSVPYTPTPPPLPTVLKNLKSLIS